MDTSYNCVICLKELNMNDGVLTPCRHRYHSDCFFRWIYKNKTCPLCRKDLIAPSEDENMLDEVRRQIDWESSIYATLRNNTTVLERSIVEKRQFLKKLEEEVMLKRRQLRTIQEKYREFMQTSQRRRRRRQGLLF
jgi:hypothetical protein